MDTISIKNNIRFELEAVYKTINRRNLRCNWFILANGNDRYHIFIDKDYGMWQVSIYRNWRGIGNCDECLLDRRAFNLDGNYQTIRWFVDGEEQPSFICESEDQYGVIAQGLREVAEKNNR